MFETLEDQIKTDEEKVTTKQERVVMWAVIALVSIVLFAALYFGLMWI